MSAQQRPAGVPEHAVWHGGMDGGSFFVLERHLSFSGLYRARVWHDWTGELLVDGAFAVHAPGDPVVDVADERLVEFYDGERIMLADGRELVQVPWIPPRAQDAETASGIG